MPDLPTDVMLYTAPAFALLIIIEMISFWVHQRENERGYGTRDTATSLAMLGGNLLTQVVFRIPVLALYMLVYELTPARIPFVLAALPLLLLVQDFLAYWGHRCHHVIRVLWAEHVVHHSSERFNLSTATRMSWTDLINPLFYLPMVALGVHPAAVFFCTSLNLTYQFFLHTERVGTLPRPIEAVFNTPSHHRVHHASQGDYLDRNFGGILIVWDRLFGTFAAERADEPCKYGLTKDIETYNPFRVATHEYAAMFRDLSTARNWRERAGYLFGKPGWRPQDTEPTPEPGAAVESAVPEHARQ